MKGKKTRFFDRVLAFVLSLAMIMSFGVTTAFADDPVTHGKWEIVNNGTSSGVATLKEDGVSFKYVSSTTELTTQGTGTIGDVTSAIIQSKSTNGKQSGGIVDRSMSYAEYVADKTGTATFYVGNAATKLSCVSRIKTGETSGDEGLGTFYPGADGGEQTPKLNIVQGAYCTINVEVEAGYTYFLTVTSSKMKLYDLVKFMGSGSVKGTVTVPAGVTDYGIKFVDKATGDIKEVILDKATNTYTAGIKPGSTYDIVITGEAASTCIVDGSSTFTATEGENTVNITLKTADIAVVSGALTGIADGYSLEDLGFVFKPTNENYPSVTADIDKTAKTYKANLLANEKYTLETTGAYDYSIEEIKDTAFPSTVTKDIAFTAKTLYDVSGNFVTSDNGAVKVETVVFENMADKYTYSGTVAEGGFTGKLRDGDYAVTTEVDKNEDGTGNYISATHISVKGGNVSKDIYFVPKDAPKTAYAKDIYVDANGTADATHFTSLKDAINTINNMDPQPTSEAERITIHIAPGLYRAQHRLKTPYVSLVNTDPSKEVKLTWYYGIGYRYYSSGADGFYNELNAKDKFLKNNQHPDSDSADVQRWGGAFYVDRTAHDFYAENIVFENSFNKYVTDEEIEDGVTPRNQGASTKGERTKSTDVWSKGKYIERAAAILAEADNLEFYKCKFLSNQDTLYTHPGNDMYFKDCYIEGMTDYIFGDGQLIFDKCELNFCGYSDSDTGGEITAMKNDNDKKGVIFNECKITANPKATGQEGAEIIVGTGGYGRMWGNKDKKHPMTIQFINSTIQKAGLISDGGWSSMESSPADNFLYEYNNKLADGTAVATKSATKQLTDEDIKTLDASKASYFDQGDIWAPRHYADFKIKTADEFGQGGDDDTTESSTENTTENTTESTTEQQPARPDVKDLGDFDGDGKVNVKDASDLLLYVLGDDSIEITDAKIDAGEVSGDKRITAADAAQILTKVLNPDFKFTRNYAYPNIILQPLPSTTEKPAESTSESASESESESEPSTGGGDTGTPTLWAIGDSTMCNYTSEHTEAYNFREGWGMQLENVFDTSKINIKNIARSGRSTRDFRFFKDGTYKPYEDFITNVKAGDYVLIQLGHNDQKDPLEIPKNSTTIQVSGYGQKDDYVGGADAGRSSAANLPDWQTAADENGYITVEGTPKFAGSCLEEGKIPSFEAILYKFYVKAALDKGAHPILVTPIVRSTGEKDSTGKFYVKLTASNKKEHEQVKWSVTGAEVAKTNAEIGGLLKDGKMDYIKGVKDVATYAEVPVVDLASLSDVYWTAYIAANGSANDLHANDKGVVGNKDRTHLSRQGATVAAQLVASDIKTQGLDLAKYVKSDVQKPVVGGGTNPPEESTENSTEASTEASTDTPVIPDGDVSFNDTDSFTDYLAEDHKDANINLAHADDVNGNATGKIYIGNKAVAKRFATPATSGKWEFSADFLSTNVDAVGRSFRIYFESAAQEGTDTQTAGGIIAGAASYITTWDMTKVFYHLTDVGNKILSVITDNTGYKAIDSDSVEVGDLEANVWYHISVTVDLDAKTATTAIYKHGTDGKWAPDTAWTTPIAPAQTTNLIKEAAIGQVRLVRTVGGDVYFDNVSLKKAN